MSVSRFVTSVPPFSVNIVTGTATYETLRDLLDGLPLDRGLGDAGTVLICFETVTRFAFSFSDVIAAVRSRKGFGAGPAIVVVHAPGDLAFGMARMLQRGFLHDPSLTLIVERCEARALAHCGAPIGRLAEILQNCTPRLA